VNSFTDDMKNGNKMRLLTTQLRETSRIECRYRDMQLTIVTCIYESQGIFPSAINSKPPHLRGVPSGYNIIS